MAQAEEKEQEDMSDMSTEPVPGQGNMLTRKYGGIPGWVILGAVGVAAYFFFFKGKSSTSTSGTSGSGTTGSSPTTGNITIRPTYNVAVPAGSSTSNPQPTPTTSPKTTTTSTSAA